MVEIEKKFEVSLVWVTKQLKLVNELSNEDIKVSINPQQANSKDLID